MKINAQNTSIAKTSNISNSKTAKDFSSANTMQDKVSFTGTIIRPVKDRTEIKELVNFFYDSVKHNLDPGKKSTFLDKISKYLAIKEFSFTTKLPGNITEVVKSENKIAGGYSMSINKDSTAHLGFMTLVPEFMRTKTGIEILKGMGKRICENAELNNVETLTWTTNKRNRPINLLLRRIGAEKTRNFAFGESEYKISIKDLKKRLDGI